jgi:hypothetical protein
MNIPLLQLRNELFPLLHLRNELFPLLHLRNEKQMEGKNRGKQMVGKSRLRPRKQMVPKSRLFVRIPRKQLEGQSRLFVRIPRKQMISEKLKNLKLDTNSNILEDSLLNLKRSSEYSVAFLWGLFLSVGEFNIRVRLDQGFYFVPVFRISQIENS